MGRRKLPPLTRRQVMRLSPELIAAHQAWQEAELLTPAHEQQRRRSRRLALSLVELGEDAQATEEQLARSSSGSSPAGGPGDDADVRRGCRTFLSDAEPDVAAHV